jgi:multidrug efflux pump subunit AcrA (membrane-fusion protein)
VPNAALRFRPSRGERVERAAIAPSAGGTSRGATIVHVESGGALREVPVVVGLADDRFSEIRDGAIAPGDRLVTGYR